MSHVRVVVSSARVLEHIMGAKKAWEQPWQMAWLAEPCLPLHIRDHVERAQGLHGDSLWAGNVPLGWRVIFSWWFYSDEL